MCKKGVVAFTACIMVKSLSSERCFLLQANLGLLKVLVAKSQAEGLQTHMRGMVEALLSWQGSHKNHFKAKVSKSLQLH